MSITTTTDHTPQQPISVTPTDPNDLREVFLQLRDRSSDLVFYANTGPVEYMEEQGMPDHIIKMIRDKQCLIEEMLPEEVSALKCPNCQDGAAGYNRGFLDAITFALIAMEIDEFKDEDGESYFLGGIDDAIQQLEGDEDF